jgi:hypothetical protein
MGTEPTTAEAAAGVRGVVSQAVISEAGKSPALQAGQVHDRMLGMLLGGFVAYFCSNIPGHEIASVDKAQALGVACAGLGVQIAAKVPEAYRPWLQSLAAIGAVLLGVTVS